jgi:hypothetical protein
LDHFTYLPVIGHEKQTLPEYLANGPDGKLDYLKFPNPLSPSVLPWHHVSRLDLGDAPFSTTPCAHWESFNFRENPSMAL